MDELKESSEKISKILDTVRRFIVGHEDLLRLMAVAAVSGGHMLVEGPTGIGKTTAARILSQSLGGAFRRIQMTPDLLPSDIVGAYYFDVGKGEWALREGPLFANVVLVDELNRAPPRTQSALLEAMQEMQVSIEGRTLPLPRPFLVIATQMGPGAEGTYPLTPVLVDRFAYSYRASYPRPEEEIEIVVRADHVESARIDPVVGPGDLLRIQQAAKKIHVSDKVLRYIVELVNRVRRMEEVLVGPSPRASIWLYRGARASALLEGLDYVAPDHVKMIAVHAIAHRVRIKPEYEAEGASPEALVAKALEEVEVPKI